ncbi:MAG: 6-phosphofructokinase, partial [Candidatus Omnitrophica bacterium]|nr:6-phosphofructokinase [Candidatus Omnitrophota bacterium]
QPNIMFIEAMGRDSGRLAFEASRGDNFEGLTDAEIKIQEELRDTIIVITPEYPVSLEEIRVAIQGKIDQYNACTVVVAEGFRIQEDPSAGVDESEVDPAGHKHYEGIAQELASRLKPSFSTAKIRSNMYLTYEGRGVVPTDYDIAMGTNIGHMAARLLLEGTTGGRFVGYTNPMNPLVDGPIVLELTGISNRNDLRNPDLYDPQTLGRNGVLMP